MDIVRFRALTWRKRSNTRFVLKGARPGQIWRLHGWEDVCRALARDGLLRWDKDARGWVITPAGLALQKDIMR